MTPDEGRELKDRVYETMLSTVRNMEDALYEVETKLFSGQPLFHNVRLTLRNVVHLGEEFRQF